METNDSELNEFEKELTILAKREAPKILEKIQKGYRPCAVDRVLLRMAQNEVGKRRVKKSGQNGSQITLTQ